MSITINDHLTCNNGLVVKVTETNDNITLSNSSYIVNMTFKDKVVTLPTSSDTDAFVIGRMYYIHNSTVSAETSDITIAAGVNKINGTVGNTTLGKGDSVTLYLSNTNSPADWYII